MQQERIDLAARELTEVSDRLQAAANALRESSLTSFLAHPTAHGDLEEDWRKPPCCGNQVVDDAALHG